MRAYQEYANGGLALLLINFEGLQNFWIMYIVLNISKFSSRYTTYLSRFGINNISWGFFFNVSRYSLLKEFMACFVILTVESDAEVVGSMPTHHN